MHPRRLLIPAAAGAVALSVLGAVVLHGEAFRSLGSAGPTAGAFDLLEAANRALVVDASLLFALGLLVDPTRRTRIAAVALPAAATLVLAVSGGAQALGTALADVRPLQQPLQLNSLLLAVGGSGRTVLPAAVVLAAAAAVCALLGRVRSSRARPAGAGG